MLQKSGVLFLHLLLLHHMRMKRQGEAVQRNFTRVPDLQKPRAPRNTLYKTVLVKREANRYSGLRSLHVVRSD